MAYKVRTDFTFLNSWGKIKRRVLVTHEVEMSGSINKVGWHTATPSSVSSWRLLWRCGGRAAAADPRAIEADTFTAGPLWEKFAGPWCREANGGDTGSPDTVQIPALPVHGHGKGLPGPRSLHL